MVLVCVAEIQSEEVRKGSKKRKRVHEVTETLIKLYGADVNARYMIFVTCHVFLINGIGQVIIDTDPRLGLDRRPVGRIYRAEKKD